MKQLYAITTICDFNTDCSLKALSACALVIASNEEEATLKGSARFPCHQGAFEATALSEIDGYKIIVKELPEAEPAQKSVSIGAIYTVGIYTRKPVEWIVLDVQADKALLLAKDCLMLAPYNKGYKSTTWGTCSLRNEVLPELFEQIFSGKEKARVLMATNANPDNARYGTPGGTDAEDKLFLLGIDEVKQYFPNGESRTAEFIGNTVWWWLRSPGSSSYYAANVNYDGYVYEYGSRVSWSSGAVRPAFWLNLQS